MPSWATLPCAHTAATVSARLSASSWSWVTKRAVAAAAGGCAGPPRGPRREDRRRGWRRARRAGHRRARRQRAGERYPLLLAAGQLVGQRWPSLADPRTRAARRRSVWRSGPGGRGRKPTLAGDVQVREERVVLEHHADAALFRRHNTPGPRDGPRPPIAICRRRALEAGDQAQGGRLAAPRARAVRRSEPASTSSSTPSTARVAPKLFCSPLRRSGAAVASGGGAIRCAPRPAQTAGRAAPRRPRAGSARGSRWPRRSQRSSRSRSP